LSPRLATNPTRTTLRSIDTLHPEPIISAVRNGVLLCLLCAGLVRAQYLETTIPLSFDLSDIIWNPANNHVYACNYNKDSVTVIDGASNEVTSTMRVASYPTTLCLNPTAGKVYCISGESDTLSVIDATCDSVRKRIRVRGVPIRMACNTLMNKLYVVCTDDNMVRVYDGAGDTLVAEVTFGTTSTPYDLLWHPITNRIFCTTDSDTVFVIDCNTDMVTAKVMVGEQPHAICRNPTNNLVYVGTGQSIDVLSPTGESLVATIPVSRRFTTDLCAVPRCNKVYAARLEWLYIIDGGSNVVSESIAGLAFLLICDEDRSRVYVASDSVRVFDAERDNLLLTFPVAGEVAAAWNRLEGRTYVVNRRHDSVHVFRDTTTGVAESAVDVTYRPRSEATVCRGVLRLVGSESATLLDPTGRLAAILRPGGNDIHKLKSGVYFARSDRDALTRRVIIQN
jgi:YVTN family beta-propeller protein